MEIVHRVGEFCALKVMLSRSGKVCQSFIICEFCFTEMVSGIEVLYDLAFKDMTSNYKMR